MSAHTPGPWFVNHRPTRTMIDPDIAVVFQSPSQHDGSRSKTREANARLIAAAPELLGACKYLLELIQEVTGGEGTIEQMMAMDAARELIEYVYASH